MSNWIQLGIFFLGLAGAAVGVINSINKSIDKKTERADLQFAKIDLKFDDVMRQINTKIEGVVGQLDKIRDVGNERHVDNVKRLSLLEGQISAFTKIFSNGIKPPSP